MSNVTINQLPTASTIDATADLLAIYTASSVATQSINRNTFLGITGSPVGNSDTQTLTNKTITAPTISSPVLSGTITGTYTIGGTPTFPSSVVTLTGSQTLTNKVLTSPTINAPTITNATISADALAGFSASTTGTVYGVSVASGVIASAALNNAVNTAAIQSNAITYTKVATGFAVQMQQTTSTAVATGTTIIPQDDTIPQSTEGDQYMTLSITPKSTTNILVIDVNAFLSHGSVATFLMAALFQDSGANALAVDGIYQSTATGVATVRVRHQMVAGTTSATTFKVRCGASNAGTVTFNGVSGSRVFGAITKSSIVITEYTA